MNVVVSTPDAIVTAAQALEAGRLVAFPTETVYGLGADAENPAAVADIYKAKGRPSDHPVIVHVAPGADIRYWAKDIPHEADQLIAAFWPGPLTLILKRADHIPDAVSGGQDTVGIAALRILWRNNYCLLLKTVKVALLHLRQTSLVMSARRWRSM
jgi:L-threonylcarbamoyladenylate synthase